MSAGNAIGMGGTAVSIGTRHGGEREPAGLVPQLRLMGTVTGVIVTIVVASQGVELFINRVLRPDVKEWTWISEILLIGALSFTTTLWSRLRLARTAVADLELRQLRIQTELAVAAKVQRALLPVIPEPMHGVSWYAAMEPAGAVGGDYYDFFPVGEDRMCLVLADVSGKGVPAAVFVSNTRAVLRAVARTQPTPSRLLTTVSETVRLDGRGTVYVTCFVAIVNVRQRTMVYANAGHPPGVILGRRTRATLAVGGPPLGLLAAAHYDDACVSLESGDLVVVVSDGITDALDAGGEDIPRVVGATVADAPALSPEAACAALLAAARVGRGPAGAPEWADDRTVIAVGVSATDA